MKFLIDLYARPLTKELFSVSYRELNFIDHSYHWDESINIFLSDSGGFWDHFSSQLSNKSLYKIIFILDIIPTSYYDSYHGVTEYDEECYVDKVLLFDIACNFSELREFYLTLRESGEIL